MSASIPSGRTRRGLIAACGVGACSVGLVALLAGCGGGSGDNRNVLLPPGGVAIGNIMCASTAVPPTNEVAHGETITVRFTLTDANIALAGANLPVSFDVVGGSLLNPPTHTDANGVVEVLFRANEYTYVGPGRVRLIGPTDPRLICDVAFTVYRPRFILRAIVLNGSNAIVTGLDACGSTEMNVERQETRKIKYFVTRVNPETGIEEPVFGFPIRLTATGLTFNELQVTPFDASGTVTQIITPFPTGEGSAVVTARIDRDDLAGLLGSNTCVVSFNIINPICNDDGDTVTPVYRSAFGVVKPGPLRPGESADLTASFVVDGVPQANRAILVDAANGFVNGSENPVTVMTDGAGFVTVTYTARDGFSGTDVVTFQDSLGTLQCTQTANVSVVTCDIAVDFGAPVTSGADVPVTIRVLNTDLATALGETVSLDVVGGFFTNQPPMYDLVNVGGFPAVQTTLHVTPGFSGPSQISLSFVSGYPCNSVTESFTVLP